MTNTDRHTILADLGRTIFACERWHHARAHAGGLPTLAAAAAGLRAALDAAHTTGDAPVVEATFPLEAEVAAFEAEDEREDGQREDALAALAAAQGGLRRRSVVRCPACCLDVKVEGAARPRLAVHSLGTFNCGGSGRPVPRVMLEA